MLFNKLPLGIGGFYGWKKIHRWNPLFIESVAALQKTCAASRLRSRRAEAASEWPEGRLWGSSYLSLPVIMKNVVDTSWHVMWGTTIWLKWSWHVMLHSALLCLLCFSSPLMPEFRKMKIEGEKKKSLLFLALIEHIHIYSSVWKMRKVTIGGIKVCCSCCR